MEKAALAREVPAFRFFFGQLRVRGGTGEWNPLLWPLCAGL
jgi:hypothetical protein